MPKSTPEACKLCKLPTKYRVPIKDLVFCPACYYTHFASFCELCDKKIRLDEESVDWKGMVWHQSCFVCYECRQVVTTKPFFYEKYRTLMCANCCKKYVISNFNCTGCGKKILVDDQTVAIDMEPYHKNCFKCSFCTAKLELDNYEKKGDRLQCHACKIKSAPRCKDCTKPILSGAVKFEQGIYHRKCLKCEDCGKHVQERIMRQNMALRCTKCQENNGVQKAPMKKPPTEMKGSKDQDQNSQQKGPDRKTSTLSVSKGKNPEKRQGSKISRNLSTEKKSSQKIK